MFSEKPSRICTIIIFAIISAFLSLTAETKDSDLAGAWYTASPGELKSEIERYLENSFVEVPEGKIIGTVVPHAGIRYSGPVAGYSYKLLQKISPKTIILVGFAHHKYLEDKIAVFTDTYFSTPLGKAFIDQDITRQFLEYGGNIIEAPEAFDYENSIELQIPFIQTAAKDAKLVILAMLDQKAVDYKFLGEAIYSIMKDKKDFVLIASTDMSHYLTYGEANRKDKGTITAIETMAPDKFYETSLQSGHSLVCGYGALCAVMEASVKLGADKMRILKYANSGDTSGEKNRVVGYLSAVFLKSGEKTKEERRMLNKEEKEELLKIARDTIKFKLSEGGTLQVGTEDEELKKDMGAFVTLHKKGMLRGCIGSMVARAPLYLTVRDMAIAAATQDPRFPPVALDELDDIDIEISVLTPMERIDDPNLIEMGRHGVMVQRGMRSGVYLPQVAVETGWNREQFMNSLCSHKAGIPQDSWKTGECDIYIFSAEVFGEKDTQ